ncbi:hypothetical protein NEF87_004913 [Candidatus Lokiarchaeum ossiferum]|uniref:EF-hand domain-containing protein n=1 Tax=Candidatus Lokiarchaeum ossiferum TaxID=2951803 RepID=A0ABY6HYL5_9ARCH|nr:hypothetical protein NEF87_004913 [Candidatus Lokiarchaeum sp. B-35]
MLPLLEKFSFKSFLLCCLMLILINPYESFLTTKDSLDTTSEQLRSINPIVSNPYPPSSAALPIYFDPSLFGEIDVHMKGPTIMRVTESFLYIAAEYYILVYDIEDLHNPKKLGFYALTPQDIIIDFVVGEDYLYAVSSSNKFSIFGEKSGTNTYPIKEFFLESSPRSMVLTEDFVYVNMPFYGIAKYNQYDGLGIFQWGMYPLTHCDVFAITDELLFTIQNSHDLGVTNMSAPNDQNLMVNSSFPWEITSLTVAMDRLLIGTNYQIREYSLLPEEFLQNRATLDNIPQNGIVVTEKYILGVSTDYQLFGYYYRNSYWNKLYFQAFEHLQISAVAASNNLACVYDWEKGIFLIDLGKDTDADKLTNLQETQSFGTNPLDPDSEADGLTDHEECILYFTDPWNNDTDDDTLSDSDEVKQYHSNPLLKDSDSDHINDPVEILIIGSNPNLKDSDGDALSDDLEYYTLHTNVTDPDSDEDQMWDGWEIQYNYNPLDSSDAELDDDNDNLSTVMEFFAGTHPLLNDSDGDKLSDGEEILRYLTNPCLFDSDADDLSDWDEIKIYQTNPCKLDTDGDKLSDYFEIYTSKSSPLQMDTDHDKLSDYDELYTHGTSLTSNDTDQDGLLDFDEIYIYYSDPTLIDSDGDGLNDSEEVQLGTSLQNPDSDGDGWRDSRDRFPLDWTRPWIPFIGALIGLGILCGVGVMIVRKRQLAQIQRKEDLQIRDAQKQAEMMKELKLQNQHAFEEDHYRSPLAEIFVSASNHPSSELGDRLLKLKTQVRTDFAANLITDVGFEQIIAEISKIDHLLGLWLCKEMNLIPQKDTPPLEIEPYFLEMSPVVQEIQAQFKTFDQLSKSQRLHILLTGSVRKIQYNLKKIRQSAKQFSPEEIARCLSLNKKQIRRFLQI